MRYWVMKGNPSSYDWEENLRPGRREGWHNYRVPKDISSGHRIFFWESAPKLRIVGLGTFLSREPERDDESRIVFWVCYLTRRIKWMPDIHLLKCIDEFRDASFLKRGPKQTTYPITDEQAHILYRIVAERNEGIPVWKDAVGTSLIQNEDSTVLEGGPKVLAHVLLERRNRSIVEKKKAAFRVKYGKLFCECCKMEPAERYGPEAEGLCEVHHRRPLSVAEAEVHTALKDLAVLCPNCHQAIHRFTPMISVERLSKRLKRPNLK